MIEYSHRAVVVLVSVLAVAVAWLAWRDYRARPDILRPALLAVLLLPFQALLGAGAVWLELPPGMVAFHFVVGLLFLATITCAAAAWRKDERTATDGFARLVWASVLAGLALVSVGGEGRAHEILTGFHVGGAGTVWAALLALAVCSGPLGRRETATRAVRLSTGAAN